MRRPRVYVAGAYSDNNVLGVLRNIGRGQYWGSRLFQLGFSPFVPWHDKEFVISDWFKEYEVNDFYEYSLEWLSVSEAIFVVPNHILLKDWEDSKGTLAEIQDANKRNIPVFYDVDSLIEWKNNLLKTEIK